MECDAGRRTGRIGWWSAVVALLVPGAAGANMFVPLEEFRIVEADAGPWTREVTVLHETLQIDCRPLEADERAIVQADYRLWNAGAAVEGSLLFVSPAVSDGEVRLDGHRLLAEATTLCDPPEAWRAPPTVPGLDGPARPYRFRGRAGVPCRDGDPSRTALRVMARLEHGEHALSVRYRALADRSLDPLRYPAHQIAYVFGTTSPWAAFERLAVEVLVPPTWEAASSLPLERRQDRLVGTFAGLPGASFGLAVRRPVPAWAALLPLWPWLGGLAGLLVAVLCARAVAMRRERVRPGVRLAVGAVLLAFAVSAGIAALFAWAAARFAAHVLGAAGLVPPPSVLVAYPLSVGGLPLLAGCVGALLVLVARQGQDPATGQDRTTGYCPEALRC